MSGQTSLTFPILTNARYSGVVDRAKQSIQRRLELPKFERFKSGVVSQYPHWFLWAVLTALLCVMVFSFVISAGKQAAAAAMLFDHLPTRFSRLSDLWASVSVAFMLLLSEFGAVLFLVGAGTLSTAAPQATVAGRHINVVAWVFRAFAALCASYAIIANATITVLDPVPQAALFQWTVSIGVPALVLGLGVMLERILIDALRSRNEQYAKYQKAVIDYETALAQPEKHPDYGSTFASELWSELIRYKAAREILEALVIDDKANKSRILAAEFQAQRRIGEVEWEVSEPIPFLLSKPELPLQ